MTEFSAAISALLADSNMGVDAIYRQGGAGMGAALRVFREAPDEELTFGGSTMLSGTLIIEVPISSAPALASGDTFEIAGQVYTVRGAPSQDTDALLWRAEASPS